MDLSDRVADCDLSDNGTYFLRMVQHCLKDEKSPCNCVNIQKIVMLQWKISRCLPQLNSENIQHMELTTLFN